MSARVFNLATYHCAFRIRGKKKKEDIITALTSLMISLNSKAKKKLCHQIKSRVEQVGMFFSFN